MLALRPRQHPAVWLLVILHKVAVAATAVLYAATRDAIDASSVAVADGILSALLIAALVLLRLWVRKQHV